MKKLTILFLCVFPLITNAQNLTGAWENNSVSENGDSIKNVVIFAEGYQVATTYYIKTGKFIGANGGTWKLDDDTMTEKVEFDSQKPERVGSKLSFQIKVTDQELQIVGRDAKWNRIDDGTPGQLQGAWLMSGRIRDDALETRDTSRPRKTMKMLSGTRFQWIAYNTETKEFKGTGGGTYTTENGEYTENIEFFSRDDSKAGLSLQFNYELIDSQWNHKGFSSKGDPIHEVWSIRE